MCVPIVEHVMSFWTPTAGEIEQVYSLANFCTAGHWVVVVWGNRDRISPPRSLSRLWAVGDFV